MRKPIAFSISVHAAPTDATAHDEALTITFTGGFTTYPDITIYTGDAGLAEDLAAAIKAVLAKHAKQEAA